MPAYRRSAFTLLELIIVIALVGALLALGVANFSVLPGERTLTPKGFLALSLKRARADSQKLGCGISLFYDEARRDMVACVTEDGSELWRINLLGEKPLKDGEEDGRTDFAIQNLKKIEIKMYPIFPDIVNYASSVSSSSLSGMELSAMRFHPDMASTPVRIVMKADGEEEIVHIPDPFSGHHFIGSTARRKESK